MDSFPNPVDRGRSIRAVLFDLDGTLYHQSRLRRLMAVELMALPLAGPFQAPRRWRALAAYREAMEQLRAAAPNGPVPAAQIKAASMKTGLSTTDVERLVDDWMIKRPLKHLMRCRVAGIDQLLDLLRGRGVRAGVLSDYPADAKLEALGLAGRFAPVLCTTDPAIAALKPNPRGFLRACEVWQLEPREVLMVGDRVEVDAAGAAAAGMPCVIIGRGEEAGSAQFGQLMLPSLERLRGVLDQSR